MLEPLTLTIWRWCVFRSSDGEMRLVGWCVEEGQGRVSGPILSFDPATSICTTASHVYRLDGEPAVDLTAALLWQSSGPPGDWCEISDDLWKQLRHSA